MPRAQTAQVDTSFRPYGAAYGMRERANRERLVVAALWLVAGGNAVAIVWLWYHGGNVDGSSLDRGAAHEHRTDHRAARRLLGADPGVAARAASRAGARIGFDRLTVWHRWNGHACLYLILAHVVFSVLGYALDGPIHDREGDLDHDLGWRLPVHDPRDDRDLPLHRGRRRASS